MSSPRQPTMQDIADAAGVSRMAVSLALRNSPKISEATKNRVRDVAEKLGYRPNPMISALMTQLRQSRVGQRPSIMAYVTAHPSEDGWRKDATFSAFYEGARRRAESLGYRLEEWWLRKPGLTEARFCEILYTRNIPGIVLAPLPGGGGAIELNWPFFAGAAIGYSLTGPALHRASNDQYDTIRTALAELTALGYQRIGLALPQEFDDRVKHHWTAGLFVYQQGIAPEQRVRPLLAGPEWTRAFMDWFRAERPDAVVSLCDDVPKLIASVGSSIPDEVGFAHLSLTSQQRDWAGVNQNSELVGAAAVDLVDAQLRRNERGVPEVFKTTLIPGRWEPGPTVRDVRNLNPKKSRRRS